MVSFLPPQEPVLALFIESLWCGFCFFWVFADTCRLNVLLSPAFSLSPSLKSTHTMSSLVKSSGCFAVLRLMWCPHGPALRGPLRSLFLLLADNPQRLLWLQCRWRASLSFPTHPFLSQGSREATQLLNRRCRHHCVSRLLAWLLHFSLHLWSYPFGGTPVRPSCWFVV